MSEPVKTKSSNDKIIGVVILVLVVIAVGYLLIDVVKTPLWLNGEFFTSHIESGYDLICDTRMGMQLCLMNHTPDNYVVMDQKKTQIGIEYTDQHPCLSVILKNETVINDYPAETQTEKDCKYAFLFKSEDGWKFGKLGSENDTFGTYYVGKIRSVWWEKLANINADMPK